MVKQIDDIKSQFQTELKEVKEAKELEEIKLKYLGRNGCLQEVLRSIGKAPPEERKAIGQQANIAKKEIDAIITSKMEELEKKSLLEEPTEFIDLTKPLPSSKGGTLHPITLITNEIVDIFLSMGFMIFDGPMMENDYHNFEALNIPKDHPARDMQDTFWLKNGNLLRTHTSSVQIRAMEKFKPPFKGIAPGRVFRYEALDASHENTFYQCEGLLIDKDISVANLIYFMKQLLTRIFKQEMTVRLRPGYFPFVEPGFELDMKCVICQGKGCSVCKRTGWVEILPCGLVHPNVLKMGGIDTNEYGGFAFGLGLSRLVMMRYNIDDIRHLNSADLRFLNQFQTNQSSLS